MVPLEPSGAVLEDHAVALRDGLIEAVLPRAAAESRYASYERHALDEHILLPGLVNACAGAAPGTWTAMLRGGSTCVSDVFTESGLEAALAGGMRVAARLTVSEPDPDGDLARGLALRDQWREHPLVSFCLCGGTALPESLLRKLLTMAAEVQVPVHLSGPMPYRGLLGPELVLVNPAFEGLDLEMLAKHGVSVVHIPAALSRTPVAGMAALGINVALGSAGNLLQDLRIAALPAPAALHAATLGGARALGLESRIGSIVPGKAADLVAARLDVGVPLDPVSTFVYLADEQQVSDVWISGKHLLRDGRTE